MRTGQAAQLSRTPGSLPSSRLGRYLARSSVGPFWQVFEQFAEGHLDSRMFVRRKQHADGAGKLQDVF